MNRLTGGVALAVLMLVTGLLGTTLHRIQDARHAQRRDAFARLLDVAQAEVEATRARRALWLDTEVHLAQARRSGAAGDLDSAFRFARAARREARLARNQYSLESARYALALHRATLAPSDAARLAALIGSHDGYAAWSLARRLGVASGE